MKKLFLWYMGYRWYWVPDTLHPLSGLGDIGRTVLFQGHNYIVRTAWYTIEEMTLDEYERKTMVNANRSQLIPMKRVYMSKYTYQRIMRYE